LLALDDEAVAQRHRRYVGAFKFEHPQVFEEYLSFHHVDFWCGATEFRNAEQAKRAARLPPLSENLSKYYGPYEAPPVDPTNVAVEDLEDLISLPLPPGVELEDDTRPPRPEHLEAVALLRQPTGRGDAVFTVLRSLGLGALRPDHWEVAASSDPAGAEERRVGAELRDLMWSKIESWYDDARLGLSLESRRTAAKHLQRLGAILAGEQRGRGRSTVADLMRVKSTYYTFLYRLLRAIALLHDWPWAETGQTRIEAVAWTCFLAEARLREYLQRDSRQNGWPPVRAASEWTCSLYGIRRKTLSNLLTVKRRPPSPK
jgi:hypothetical protein